MIIRKKTDKSKEGTSSQNIIKPNSKRNIIKKEDLNFNKKEQIKEIDPKPLKQETKENQTQLEDFEKIDISNIDFKERIERRKGERRRGYRRIDERSLVSRAQQEAHTIKELAAREGYKTGLLNAQGQIEDIKSAIAEFLSSKDKMYEEFYPHIMEISFEIAKKIIKKEVELSDEVLKNVIMSVLDEISSDTQKIEIKVNSTDYEFASASIPEFMEHKQIQARIIVSKDDSIEKGSAIVIANNGVIDADFKTQLAILQNAFGIYTGGL